MPQRETQNFHPARYTQYDGHGNAGTDRLPGRQLQAIMNGGGRDARDAQVSCSGHDEERMSPPRMAEESAEAQRGRQEEAEMRDVLTRIQNDPQVWAIVRRLFDPILVTKTESPNFGLPAVLGPTPATSVQIVTPDGQNLQHVAERKAYIIKAVNAALNTIQNIPKGAEALDRGYPEGTQTLSPDEARQNVAQVARMKALCDELEGKLNVLRDAVATLEAEEEQFQTDAQKLHRHVSEMMQFNEKRFQELSARLTEEANIKRAEFEKILSNAEAASARIEMLKAALFSTLQEKDIIYEQANKHWEEWRKAAVHAYAAQCAKYKRAKWQFTHVQKLLTHTPLIQPLKDQLHTLEAAMVRERHCHEASWAATRKAVQTSMKMLQDEMQNLEQLRNLERQRHAEISMKLKLGGTFHEMLNKLETEMEMNTKWIVGMEDHFCLYKHVLSRLDHELAPVGEHAENDSRVGEVMGSVYEFENESVLGSRPQTVAMSENGSEWVSE